MRRGTRLAAAGLAGIALGGAVAGAVTVARRPGVERCVTAAGEFPAREGGATRLLPPGVEVVGAEVRWSWGRREWRCTYEFSDGSTGRRAPVP